MFKLQSVSAKVTVVAAYGVLALTTNRNSMISEYLLEKLRKAWARRSLGAKNHYLKTDLACDEIRHG